MNIIEFCHKSKFFLLMKEGYILFKDYFRFEKFIVNYKSRLFLSVIKYSLVEQL